MSVYFQAAPIAGVDGDPARPPVSCSLRSLSCRGGLASAVLAHVDGPWVAACARCVESRRCASCGDVRAIGSGRLACDGRYLCASCGSGPVCAVHHRRICGTPRTFDFGSVCGAARVYQCGGRYTLTAPTLGEYHDGRRAGFAAQVDPWSVAHGLAGRPLLCGVEIEIDDVGDRSSAVADLYAGPLGPVIASIESDGSLDYGIEIVTQPVSPARLRSVLPEADLSVGKAKRTCGLHVHWTRAALSPATIAKVVRYFEAVPSICALARRDPTEHCRRTRKGLSRGHKTDTIRRRRNGSWRSSETRYVSVNLTNTETIEIRVAAGSTDPRTILATVEWYASVISFARATPLAVFTRTGREIERAWLRHVATMPRTETAYLRPYVVDRGVSDPVAMRIAPQIGGAPCV